MSACGKLLSHPRVHGDHDLFLVGHERVSLLHLVADPVLEHVAQDRGAHIDEPDLRNLGQVDVVREELLEPGLLRGEFQDLLDRQVLVLRHVDSLDVINVHERSLLRQDIFQEVDRRVICKKLDYF